jgi:predicted membrane metal-binding protein
MVLWNPLVLWYDAGFQLSFLATVAVIGAMRIF